MRTLLGILLLVALPSGCAVSSADRQYEPSGNLRSVEYDGYRRLHGGRDDYNGYYDDSGSPTFVRTGH